MLQNVEVIEHNVSVAQEGQKGVYSDEVQVTGVQDAAS